MFSMRIRIRSFWPAIGMFVLATILFCLPGKELPDEDWLGDIGADKIVHVVLFALLAVLWGLPFIDRTTADRNAGQLKRTLTYVILLAVAYGIAIEFIQGAYIPGRSFSLADMVADTVGSILGGVIVNHQRLIQR